MIMSSCDVSFEDKRLAALYEYDVLDTPPEESFDRITRLVKMTMGTPIAVVSLVDRDRQLFKSRQGTETIETARDISFCTHTIQKNEPLVVPNALEDPRFRDSPLVTCENGVRLYVGVPLRTPTGFNIGALCAIDTKPGTVSPDQLDVMQDLARLVVDELELQKARFDRQPDRRHDRPVLQAGGEQGAWHGAPAKARRRLHHVRSRPLQEHQRHPRARAPAIWFCGPSRRFARASSGQADIFGRVGGEEFALVLPGTSIGRDA